jgi:Holliday junction resolvasome RuvABC DNA-binding subunit
MSSIGYKVDISLLDSGKKLVQETNKQMMGRARKLAGITSKTARRSIRRTTNYFAKSPPGSPPKTHTGALRESIGWAPDTSSVVAGPRRQAIERIGQTHEHGGTEPKKLPKTNAKFENNWRLVIDGHGPIRLGESRSNNIKGISKRILKNHDQQRFYHGWGKKDLSGKNVNFTVIKTEKQKRRSREMTYLALLRLGVNRQKADKIMNKLKYNPGRENKRITQKYPARPFMIPALQKSLTYSDFAKVFSID